MNDVLLCSRLTARGAVRRAGFWAIAALACVAMLCVGRPALARKGGIGADGCDGCHSGGKSPEMSIKSSVTTIGLNQAITLTLTISAANGPAAGFYLRSSVGTFQIIDSGTRALPPDGVTHNAPRVGSGGETTFTVGWTAPSQVGGVDFVVYGVSANNDGKPSGDGAGSATASFAIGCGAGTTYYRDFDGDGYGGMMSGTSVSCVQPPLYAKVGGDCDDNSEMVHPGAPEVCDRRDNDCNGQVDENLTIGTYCQDDDGDGHGVPGKATVQGCGPSRGFGLCDNDCNDADKAIFPGAMEVCNNADDNCNDRVDENARATCGLGWCRRYGAGCSSTSTCVPGAPRKETCNFFDDDCDGVDDNGTDLELCGKPGLLCRAGVCVSAEDAGPASNEAGSGAGAVTTGTGSGGTDHEGEGAGDPVSGGMISTGVTGAPPESGGEGAGCALSRGSSAGPASWSFAAFALAALAAMGRRKRALPRLACAAVGSTRGGPGARTCAPSGDDEPARP